MALARGKVTCLKDDPRPGNTDMSTGIPGDLFMGLTKLNISQYIKKPYDLNYKAKGFEI